MAKKYDDYEMEEFFIKKVDKADNVEKALSGNDDEIGIEVVDAVVPSGEEGVPSAEVVPPTAEIAYSSTVFEESLSNYSSANVPKKGRKKKRKLGTAGIVRMLALCLCLGIFAFSCFHILERAGDNAARENIYNFDTNNTSAVPAIKRLKNYGSMDLLTFLGSEQGGIERFETLDKNTQDYYEEIRNQFINIKAKNPDCWGYIVCTELDKAYPIMKGEDNDEYLYRLYDGTTNKGGSIFADSALIDNYESNRNVVLYGHCMTDGSMFRGIKLFFDSANRYSKAQNLEILVVTESAVYIYEYFSGYRAEGDEFARCYSTNSSDSRYYEYLKARRSLNTISKDVSYDEDSKIITLITCTNLSYKPGERYVLHGILKTTCYF